MKIAVLDGNPIQTGYICETLATVGHVCNAFSEGDELLRQLRRQRFDLLVVDWNVPDMTGDRVLRWIRQNLPMNLPVLFVSSRGRDTDNSVVLNSSDGDGMVKTVSKITLLTRVGSLLNVAHQGEPPPPKKITFGIYHFDPRSRQASVGGRMITLTHKEFDLALLLFQHLGRPLSRDRIRDTVWRETADVASRTVDTHMSILRSKLGLRPENGFRLFPIYGYGYRLERIDREKVLD